MHVHPENGKSTLLFMLSVGLYTNKVTRNARASTKRKIYFTSYTFSRSLQQQSYVFMHVHPGIETPRHFLYFQL